MHDNLMQQGIELMIFGMGTVFVFLAVLIVATGIMSSLVQRFFPVIPVAAPPAINNTLDNDDERLVAVISAAIHKFRSRHK